MMNAILMLVSSCLGFAGWMLAYERGRTLSRLRHRIQLLETQVTQTHAPYVGSASQLLELVKGNLPVGASLEDVLLAMIKRARADELPERVKR